MLVLRFTCESENQHGAAADANCLTSLPHFSLVESSRLRHLVLDRAQINLSLIGAVLCDVGQPQLIDGVSGEFALDQVVVDRWSGAFCWGRLSGSGVLAIG